MNCVAWQTALGCNIFASMAAYQKLRHQPKPVLSTRECPRLSQRQRAAVGAICGKRKMMEAHVLRYGLEAIIVGVANGKLRLIRGTDDPSHKEMVTIRLSKDLRPILDSLRSEYADLRSRNDVLRACI